VVDSETGVASGWVAAEAWKTSGMAGGVSAALTFSAEEDMR
jgi:hypothetical protein